MYMYFSEGLSLALADPGGAAGARPPQQVQFLSFLHTFPLKSVRVGGWRPPPPNRSAPPQREILDPPLISTIYSLSISMYINRSELDTSLPSFPLNLLDFLDTTFVVLLAIPGIVNQRNIYIADEMERNCTLVFHSAPERTFETCSHSFKNHQD